MANNIVGFIGIDCNDHILYMSQILVKLGKKVLIVDRSETIPSEGIFPCLQDMDLSQDIIHYHNIDITTMNLKEEFVEEYDDIFISCGFNVLHMDIELCNHLVYVIDMQPYNVIKIKKFTSRHTTKKSLVIRNAVDMKLDYQWFMEQLELSIAPSEIRIINSNEQDQMNYIMNQYYQIITFDKISKQLKAYLKHFILTLYPNTSKHQLRKAYKLARKGV